MKYFSIFILLLTSNFLYSQGLIATYKVYLSHPSGLRINYTGKYYYQDNQVIKYLVADYLQDYPTGMIVTNEQTGSTLVMSTDSVQKIQYCKLDSGICISNFGYGLNSFEFPKKKAVVKNSGKEEQLHGLRCVQAFRYYSDSSSKPFEEIWYAPDIFAPSSFESGDSLGLLVKTILFGSGYSYELQNVEFVDKIPQSVFERKELKPRKKKGKKNQKN